VSAIRLIFCCLLLALCAVTENYSQPNVELFWNAADRQDTVMDFGVTLQGFPITLSFFVENNSSQTVAIYDSRPNAAPYYQIVNVPEVEPQHPRKEEFASVDFQPFFIPAGQTRSFGVIFKAVIGNVELPPDSVNESLLILRVVDSLDPLGKSRDKVFRLRALKTTKILASTTPLVKFDSVYVDPKPLTPEKKYTVENVTTQSIVVDDQRLTMKTAVIGTPEITFEKYPTAQFGPKGSIPWTFKYSPRDKGKDSATFTLVYRPNVSSAPDSLLAEVWGIGVQQQLELIGGTGTPAPVSIRADTVDFGDVFAGQKYVATVVLKNHGNLVIGYTGEQKFGAAKDTAAFQFTQPIMQGGSALRTNDFDTIKIEFSPIDGGAHVVEYRIETDLLSRKIQGIPDGAQTTKLTVIGFSKRPQIQLTPSVLDFGTLVLYPSCVSVSERIITVRNLGNADLIVDSIIVSPESNSILIDATSFTVPIASSKDVRVKYSAMQLGDITNQLLLATNSVNVPLPIQSIGKVVAPDTISVRIPEQFKAKPGRELVIPIVVEGKAVSLTSTSTIVVSFDPNLMRYRSAITAGTAAEGANITSDIESPRGVLTLSVTANGNFRQRDTFALLSFDTFIGGRAETPISLSNLTTIFGNAGCPNVLDVRTYNGQFRLDSLCGLSIKTGSNLHPVFQAGVYPNPTNGTVNVVIVKGNPIKGGADKFDIRIVDSFGRVLVKKSDLEFADETSIVNFNIEQFEPGMYFVEVSKGVVSFVILLAVQQ